MYRRRREKGQGGRNLGAKGSMAYNINRNWTQTPQHNQNHLKDLFRSTTEMALQPQKAKIEIERKRIAYSRSNLSKNNYFGQTDFSAKKPPKSALNQKVEANF